VSLGLTSYDPETLAHQALDDNPPVTDICAPLALFLMEAYDVRADAIVDRRAGSRVQKTGLVC